MLDGHIYMMCGKSHNPISWIWEVEQSWLSNLYLMQNTVYKLHDLAFSRLDGTRPTVRAEAAAYYIIFYFIWPKV
jgi:hypothetical protein